MNGALAELVWRGFRGSLVRRARLLRQPRYLVSFLATLAYFAFVFRPSFSNWNRRGAAADLSAATAGDVGQLVLFVASLVVVVVATGVWIFASSKPALALGEADLNLLLPAPLPRRKIIELSIWRQQTGLLAGALVVTLIRGSGPPSVRLARIATTWALLLLMGLHSRGVNLWKARLGELPRGAARRRIALAVGLGVAYWSALAAGLWMAARQVGAAATLRLGSGGGAAVSAIVHQLAAAPPRFLAVLLAPARWIALAILGGGRFAGLATPERGAAWLAAAGFLALAVAANYEWVVRSRVRFEDASLERARRLATRRKRQPALPAATSRDRRQEPFPLAPGGLPEVAVYWKNLIGSRRTPLARRAGLALIPGVVAGLAGRVLGTPPAILGSVAATGLMLMALPPLIAGLSRRNDLRTDLLQLEVLRPWPVRGWRLMAAELLAPATSFLTWSLAGFGLVAGCLFAAGGGLPPGTSPELERLVQRLAAGGSVAATGLVLAAAVLLASIPLTLLSVAFQNVVALALPGWSRLGTAGGGRAAGSTLTGARMLSLLAHLVVLALGLIPVGLVLAAAILLGSLAGLEPAAWQALPLALLAALPLLAEVGLLLRIAGALWDRLDPSLDLLNPEE